MVPEKGSSMIWMAPETIAYTYMIWPSMILITIFLNDVWFQVEGEEESDLIDDSVKNVDQLFEIIAEDGLRKLENKLDEEEYEEVQKCFENIN